MANPTPTPIIPRITDIPELAGSNLKNWDSISDIVSQALAYVFPIAGILVFIYLLYGGLNLMLAAGNEEGIREGKAKITNALVGFLIIFAAYWVVQALEIALGVNLLNW
ncbi:MAG: hypothetical protein PHW57_03590 [Candidatus Shapirobacteria bacterium]|nr:hypothetical protein [Candidatus Shapirobacteria bacterium]